MDANHRYIFIVGVNKVGVTNVDSSSNMFIVEVNLRSEIDPTCIDGHNRWHTL